MNKVLSIFNSKKLPMAFLIAVLCIGEFFYIECFLLPIDYFTSRAWEAVKVFHYKNFLQGPFYPNLSFTTKHCGDLAYQVGGCAGRKVHWETDIYGYRKRNLEKPKYDLVIVGDSYAAGSGLSQDKILSEVLEKKLNMVVYPLAPDFNEGTNLNRYFEDVRFVGNKPKIVIFEALEWFMWRTPELLPEKDADFLDKASFRMKLAVKPIVVILDRMQKSLMARTIINKLNEKVSILASKAGWPSGSKKTSTPRLKTKTLFYNGEKVLRTINEKKFKEIIKIMKEAQKRFDALGIKFVFMAVPNKENIHYKEFKKYQRPEMLRNLQNRLIDEGISVIDLLSLFEKEFEQNNTELYQKMDTHWNEKGVEIAADAITEYLMVSKKDFE